MSLHAFCSPTALKVGATDEQLVRLKSIFRLVMISIAFVGVASNILNLITLRSPSLKTVPFMYIRALAIFDLIGLTAIIVHFLLQVTDLDSFEFVVYYAVYIEDVLINSFLVAGLYSAVLLTVERYLLIRKPHQKRLFNIQRSVVLKIFGVLLISILLHSPMALSNVAKRDANGRIVKGNNQQLLCQEYKVLCKLPKPADPVMRSNSQEEEDRREHKQKFVLVFDFNLQRTLVHDIQLLQDISRALTSVLRHSTRGAQCNYREESADCQSESKRIWKRSKRLQSRRRLLIKRSLTPAVDCNDMVIASIRDKPRKDNNLVMAMKTFTEKKLTALMISICIIFVFGNVPQIIVMLAQNEKLDSHYSFQVFRNIANTFEVLNHCLNFFVFCLASSEYSRSFLMNCRCLTRLFLKIPSCASLLHSHRLNSNLSTLDQRDLAGYTIENSNCRRKSSLFYDMHPNERKNTVCIQVTSSTSDTRSIGSQRNPSLTPFDDCVVLRNQQISTVPELESGDEYL
ncbi:putative G-protein coupled receptor [Aphelenchoides besseyi]|nr:putative G-protein coupled receptor [Aphelenchoides besseyi]